MSSTAWTIFWWAGVALGAALLAFTGFRAGRRRMPGCCTKCGYTLAGLPGPVCPECGTQIQKSVWGTVEGQTTHPTRERLIRRALILLPLALIVLTLAGEMAFYRPIQWLRPSLFVLAFLAVLGVPLFGAIWLGARALRLPDFIGYALGAVLASHALLWWALIKASRSSDAQAGLVIIFAPFWALAAAPFGAALGWLIGAAYRRLTHPRTN